MQVATGQVASTGMVLLSYVQKVSEKVKHILVSKTIRNNMLFMHTFLYVC